MPNHQSSVVSVAVILTALTVVVLGYSAGRTHAAWLRVRTARNQIPELRRVAWARTRGLAGGILLVLALLAAAVNDVVR
jgi:uncharacterized membrane protein